MSIHNVQLTPRLSISSSWWLEVGGGGMERMGGLAVEREVVGGGLERGAGGED